MMGVAFEQPPRLQFTADTFYRMGEMGLFAGKNVALIDGELIDMPAEGARHFTAIHRTLKALEAVYGPGFVVRRPGPLELSLQTDPEPDVAVVRGELGDFAERHPTHAELVIEVSDTTLRYDRRFKLALYAAAKIPEYWIVAMPERVIEVYRLTPDEIVYEKPRLHVSGQPLLAPYANQPIDPAQIFG